MSTAAFIAHEVPIADIQIGDRSRTELGDIDGLAASIGRNQLIHPVAVTDEMLLVAGRRRLAAYERLGYDTIPVYVVAEVEDAAHLLRMERDENECRKEMVPSEKISLGRKLEELERPKAEDARREAGREAGRLGGRGNVKGSVPANETFSQRREAFDTREVVAPAVGMSTATYSRAKQLVTAAEEGDESAQAAVKEMDQTGKITPAYEKWKGEPVNRGAGAPQRRRRPTVESQPEPDGDASARITRRHSGVTSINASATKQRDVLNRAVIALGGITDGIAVITELHDEITSEEASVWIAGLSKSDASLRRVIRLLKERNA